MALVRLRGSVVGTAVVGTVVPVIVKSVVSAAVEGMDGEEHLGARFCNLVVFATTVVPQVMKLGGRF